MSTSVTYNGTSYVIPSLAEADWGTNLSTYLIALSTGSLQKAGGSFTLTADVDFGATYGLKVAYIKSRTVNPGSTGILRLANADSIVWRNATNTSDLPLALSTNKLQFNSIDLVDVSATQNLKNKTFDGTSTITGTAASYLVSNGYSIYLPTAGTSTLAVTSTTITPVAPLSGGGDLSANRTVSIPKADASTDGYLSKADWSSFHTAAASVMPLGVVLASFPNLVAYGAYVCATTTAADASGYVRCDGYTINDITSPMNGAPIPNLNNSVFLMGFATAGTAGGANTKDISHSHVNGAHTHGTDSQLGAISLSVTGSASHSHTLSSAGYVKELIINGGVLANKDSFSGASNTLGAGHWSSQGSAQNGAGNSPALGGSTDSASTGTITSTGTSASQAHTHTTNSQNNTANTSTAGSATQDFRPNYISCVYIMKIK